MLSPLGPLVFANHPKANRGSWLNLSPPINLANYSLAILYVIQSSSSEYDLKGLKKHIQNA